MHVPLIMKHVRSQTGVVKFQTCDRHRNMVISDKLLYSYACRVALVFTSVVPLGHVHIQSKLHIKDTVIHQNGGESEHEIADD